MNPNYRGVAEGKPSFGTVTIERPLNSWAAARSVLSRGNADYAPNLYPRPETLTPESLASMEAVGNGRVVSAFAADVEHINLNQTDPDGNPPSEYGENGSGNHPVLFDNFEFARALSLAVDREALVGATGSPAAAPACSMWPVSGQRSNTHDWCLDP